MIAVFENVLEDAAAAHAGQYDWLFVQHHKTTAGLADHAADRDLQYYVEAGFESLMTKYGVDIVFAGHDHIYTRSYPLNNGEAVEGMDGDDVENPGGTVYFTLNSSSGQKYYEEFAPGVEDNEDYPYFADGTKGSAALMAGKTPYAVNVYRQENRPMFMGIDVTTNMVSVKAYEVQDDLTTVVADAFTVRKTREQAPLAVIAVGGATFGDDPIELSAVGGSGDGAVSFELLSGPGALDGNALTIAGAGEIVVRARKAADAYYNESVSAERVIVVAKAASQTYTVTVNSRAVAGKDTSMVIGQYAPGATVVLTSGVSPQGRRFAGWVSSVADLTLRSSVSGKTSFVMPEQDVTVTAVFVDYAVPEFG